MPPALDPFDPQAAMMSPAAAGDARATVPPPGRLRRFTAEECQQMLKAGILHPDEPFELLDGHLMLMMSTGPRHRWCVAELARLLTLRLAEHDDTLMVDVQAPIRLNDLTEPEPDVAITRRADAPRIPPPEDVLLVVEVSDSTLATDRGDKMPRYAAAGIPEMWLVNLQREEVEVYRDPRPEAATYATKTTVGADATLTLAALPDAGTIPVADFMP
jgi:Uma2 family endonuclease